MEIGHYSRYKEITLQKKCNIFLSSVIHLFLEKKRFSIYLFIILKKSNKTGGTIIYKLSNV